MTNKKLANHVFLTLCEITLSLYTNRNTTTHSIYCKLFGERLESSKLTKADINDLTIMIRLLKKVYGFSDIEGMNYIHQYYADKAYLRCEKIVVLTNKLVPNKSALLISLR